VKIHVSIEIDANPTELWSDLSDLATHVEWMSDAVRLDFVGDQTNGVGTKFEVDTRIGPLHTTDIMTITEWDEPNVIGVDHDGLVSGSGRFVLTGHGDRTNFAWTECLSLPWWFGGRLGEVAAKPLLNLVWRRNLAALKKRIEGRFDTDIQIDNRIGAGTDAQIGNRIGTGRTGEVFEYGRHYVLRRRFDGGDLTQEVRLMHWLVEHGYPAPEPVEHDDPTALVTERIDGPSMLADLAAKPWKLSAHAKTLASLHHLLDDIPAPPWLRHLGSGDALLHLDLHPDNVLIGPRGPVVIDWTNAAVGHRDLDRALTWVLLKTGEVDGNAAMKTLVTTLRERFASIFETAAGAAAIAGHATTAAELRLLDDNVRPAEKDAIFRLARHLQDQPTHSRTDDV